MKTIFSAFKMWTQKKIKENASDWNQNDPNADGYVKNRPFYEKDGKVYQIDKKFIPVPDNLVTETDVQAVVNEVMELIGDQIEASASTKIDKENPVGTGSFSMNRMGDTVVGYYSSTLGRDNVASANYSLAEGEFTYAITDNVHVEGKYNHYDIIVEEIADDSYFTNSVGTIGYTISDITPDLEHGYYIVGNVSSSKNLNYKNVRDGIAYIKYQSAVTYLDDGTATVTNYRVVTGCTTSGSGVKFKNINYHIGHKKYAHVVGNGNSNMERSNAHTLDWDGNAWYQGDVYVGSTSGINMDEGSKKLATEDYVDEKVSSIEIPDLDVTFEQVQADWNEVDVDSPAYIANKPEKVSYFENDAGYATKEYVDAVSELVGNISVSDQISDAVSGLATESFVADKIEEAQLSREEVDLSGYATKDDLTNLVGTTNVSAQISEAIDKIDYPVDSVNGKTGAVNLTAVDVGAVDVDTFDNAIAQKSQVQIVTQDATDILSTLKIYRLTQEEYDRELAAGRIDENAIYLTPDKEVDLSEYATIDYVDEQIASIEIPDFEQVQADWDETDTTSPAYIWNKPDISGSSEPSVRAVQANWEQTDETASDFIKNKPFGEYERMIDVRSFVQYSDFTLNSNFGVNLYYVDRAESYSLTIGESYTVQWDGVDYECVAQDGSALMSGAVLLGNLSYFGLSGNNEPFIIGNIGGQGSQYFSLMDTQSGGSHTVRIYQCEIAVKKIDPKFIPIPYFGEDNIKITEIFPYLDFESENDGQKYYGLMGYTTAEQQALWDDNWETAVVVWDGVEYTCKPGLVDGVKYIGNIDVSNGTGDNGMPFGFTIATIPAGVMLDVPVYVYIINSYRDTTNTAHSISVSIVQSDIVLIDPKYIEGVSWNKILDKPFGEESGMIALFLEQEVSGFQIDPTYNLPIKLFRPISFTLVPGETYYVKWGDDTFSCVAIDGSAVIPGAVGIGNAYAFGYPNTGEPFAIISFTNPNELGIVPLDGSDAVDVCISQEGMVVTPLDAKYLPMDVLEAKIDEAISAELPDDIGAGLPEVTIDDAGKFLRVSADGSWVVEAVPNAEEASF